MMVKSNVGRLRARAGRGQEALYHGAGRFRELLVFVPKPGTIPEAVITTCAELLKSIEFGLTGKRPNILLALGTRYLELVRRPRFSAELGDQFAADNSMVLVQVAAETEDDRTYARRLVKRVCGGQLTLIHEYTGGLHLLSKEPFGFPEALPTEAIDVPLSDAEQADFATWLLYQHYVQDVEAFSALKLEEQEAVMGRPKHPTPLAQRDQGALREDSHLHVARNGAEPGNTPLVRRSMTYERYDAAGLNFLATAKHPRVLKEALARFDQLDSLRRYVDPREGGLFFVPPTSSWLGVEVKVPSPTTTAPEAAFYPNHPLVLYDLTPKAYEFFKRVFHANPDNFDQWEASDASGELQKKLRGDVKLLTRGLAKLIFGGRIHEETDAYRLLDLLLRADVTREFDVDAVSRWATHIEALRSASSAYQQALSVLTNNPKNQDQTLTALLDALIDKRKALQTTVSTDPATAAVLSHNRLSGALAPLLAEAFVADVETTAQLDAQTQLEIDRVAELCEEAADEARALNAFAGEYMTFPC